MNHQILQDRRADNEAPEQPRRSLTFAENAVLTIKILMIAAVIVGALAALVVWTR